MQGNVIEGKTISDENTWHDQQSIFSVIGSGFVTSSWILLHLSKIVLDAPGKGKHDDVIKWKHFPRNWRFVWVILRSPVNFLHKGQWRGVSMFSLICAWINGWVNTGDAGDLRRQRAHYDVIVMSWALWHLSEMLLNAPGKGKNGTIIVSPWDLWYQYICNSRCQDSHLRSFVPVFRAQWILCWQYTPLATLIRG